MCSFKKLASLWRSDFRLNTVFEESLVVPWVRSVWSRSVWPQFLKCGFWWMPGKDHLFIRDCNTNTDFSQTCPKYNLPQNTSVLVGPLQDVIVVLSNGDRNVIEDEYPVIRMSFALVSSELPHPHAVRNSVECNHTFDELGDCEVSIVGQPAICGDRIVVYYLMLPGRHMGIVPVHTSDRLEKGTCEESTRYQCFHLVDEQTFVVIDDQGRIMLYTFRELDGSPQHRITYHLPSYEYIYRPNYIFHATPSFHGAALRPDLVPGYVPSLKSQIIVLEVLSPDRSVMFVLDIAIFSEKAIHSETPVEIWWSDWGPKYVWCFPHQVTESDFNKRTVTRSENVDDPDSPDLLVRKPGDLVPSSLGYEITSNFPYTAAVCRTPFLTDGFHRFFLGQDLLTLTRCRPGAVDIQIISPVQTEVGPDLTD
ncbi:hypothetical protein DFH29DRAFT_877944 [Suillus ampliporus]|nr:hypothetical protein DFH29DRAFT_877944 [Suillus ampliporus]